VKLLVDMNLSPSWVDRLGRHGFEAIHWSTIGAATSPDVEILTWANEHKSVLITNHLDFSAILAAGGVSGPSVIQLRTQDLLSDAAVSIVANTLEAHRDDIERGALLSIRSIHVNTQLGDVAAFLDAYLERYVKPAELRSINAICSRIAVLKQHLGYLPLSALEEPDEINRFKTDSDYAEDVELATMHRALETLRAAFNWGLAQTPRSSPGLRSIDSAFG
jgi:predicted nuclease of predicted toxin-antitoxin system